MTEISELSNLVDRSNINGDVRVVQIGWVGSGSDVNQSIGYCGSGAQSWGLTGEAVRFLWWWK